MSAAARWRRRCATLLVALAPFLVPPRVATSQGVHPLPDLRPLDTRLARSDRIAFATIEAIEIGRIHVRDAVAVVGRIETEFSIKRSPSAPPPLEAGERALWLLRGARPPYVLADRPEDVVRIRSAEQERLWRRAVLQIADASGDPARLLAVYLEWLDGVSDELRGAAERALFVPNAAFFPLPDDVVEARVAAALDPDAPASTRLLSAALATRSERGVTLLLARIPGAEDAADPAVTSTALRAGLLGHDATAEAALLRALRHPRLEIRRVALGFASHLQSRSAGVASQLARMARDEPDAELREQVRKIVASPTAEPTGAE